MSEVFPLIFEPILKPRVWGGRRLQTLIDKRLPAEGHIGESWELADLEADQSVVRDGPARGRTLREMMEAWGEGLMGRAALFDGRFPLLIKFLDARETLSVQVHPDEAMARRLGGSVRVKHEAWYVIDTTPEGCIYRGFKPGVDAAAWREALSQGRVAEVLHRIPVRKGHCYYLPSGTIHALGAGVLVAEVQTPSDVTYRVFDWQRTDPATGAARDLHVDEALACISFDPVSPEAERRQHVASVWTSVTSLVRCPSFVIERVRMVEGVEQTIPYGEMVIWIVLEGGGNISCAGLREPMAFRKGDTVLLPAGLKDGQVRIHGGSSMWLEVTLPIPSSLSGLPRPERESPGDAPAGGGRYVPLGLPRA